MYWTLDADRNPVPCDMREHAAMFESADRIVDSTWIGTAIQVSTVFLGVDHNYGFEAESRPILFETMIFGGEHDEAQARYCTWDEAEAGHKQAVALLMARYVKAETEGFE